MRKIAAILLLGSLLYNWLGYRLVYDYLQHRADKALEALLDQEAYDNSRLVEIKVPLNLPYQAQWTEFERYNGEIELNGQHYKYVKRRIYNDSLVLLCLPNDTRQKIDNARNDFFRLANDLQHSSKKSSANNNPFFKTIEYRPEQNRWTIPAVAVSRSPYNREHCLLRSLYIKDTPAQPPECTTA